ncbi:unnamed protein product [Trifolium pratense]|uniref:Uncharacterized protein n=1 Tax=Trifolium pratense TaxID=57577 RepID=A0ACB0LXW2_TRIPR|nr:unnamed protein product [Trifolium pratense]
MFKKQKEKPGEKEEPWEDWPEKINNNNNHKLVVLKDPTGREIWLQYELGKELGRCEFGITYICKDRETGGELACKSISKHKLRTAMDIEDVRREVEIMRHLPKHPNIVSLKYTYEDDDHVHLVMELCHGGDLLNRIIGRGYYTERSAVSVVKTIVEVVQVHRRWQPWRSKRQTLFNSIQWFTSFPSLDYHPQPSGVSLDSILFNGSHGFSSQLLSVN